MIPSVGDTVAQRYRITAEIGVGGFGAVCAATDMHGDRTVALKFLVPDRGSQYAPTTKARYNREVRMVASMRSPHAVKLFDHGSTEQGVLYMVFEHVPGEDLSVLLRRRGTLRPPEAIHVVRQVLLALVEAHQLGLLHRDIKPDNIRVFEYMGDPLTAKLLDFGLARPTDDGHPSVTKTGEFVGTPRYMAPEQLMNEPLSATTDIFCCGMVLFELLLGADSLAGSNVSDQFARLRAEQSIDVAHLRTAVGPLADIVDRMTRPDPSARFQRAADVIAALDALASGGAQPQPQPAAPAHPMSPLHDNATLDSGGTVTIGWRTAAGLGMLLLLIGGALAVVVVLSAKDEAPPAPPPRNTPVITPVATPPEVAASDARADANAAGMHNAADAARDADVESGCGNEPLFMGSGLLDTGEWVDAKWAAYVTKKYEPNTRHAVLILLHQQGHSGVEFIDGSGFKSIADDEGLILLAPWDQAWLSAWESRERQSFEIEDMLAEAKRTFCVDDKRVFLVGHAGGGGFAQHLSCRDWVAGAAVYSITPGLGNQHFCEPAAPVPFMKLHPRDSGHDPFAGGQSCTGSMRQSVRDRERAWKSRNGCTGKPKRYYKQRATECFQWQCDGAPFRSCHTEKGRGWPGIPRRHRKFDLSNCDGENPGSDLPMAKLIWDFLGASQNETQ